MKQVLSEVPSLDAVRAAVENLPIGTSCHSDSLKLVRSGALASFGKPGVAYQVVRGVSSVCPGMQHSWVVIGDPLGVGPAVIVDVSRPTYRPEEPQRVWVGEYLRDYSNYLPRGVWLSQDGTRRCDLFEFGRIEPSCAEGDSDVHAMAFPPTLPDAVFLLDLMESKRFSRFDWGRMFSQLPMTGWEAGSPGYAVVGDILEAAAKDPRLEALIPIDHLGHVTDLNPDRLYW